MSIITKSLQNGTIYRKLGEICDIKRGDRITKAQVLPIGKGLYPVISGGITPMGYLDNFNRPQNTITIAQYGSAGFVNWQTEKFWANDICYSLFPHETLLNKKFLYYILCNNQDLLYKMVNRDAIPYHLPQINIAKLNIPTPPLEVQNEIVRILDTFTSHTAELQAELQTELQARKEQYEYYRNKLLTFNKYTQRKKLSSLVSFMNGKGHEKYIKNTGKYIVVNSKFISTNGKIKRYSDLQITPLFKNMILMVMSDLPKGKALAKCFIVEENNKYTLNQRIGAFTIKNTEIITRFLYHVLNRNKQLLAYDNGLEQTNLRKDEILNILIPIPSLSEQQRIVTILDKFEDLVNELTEGLPAEISAVQEQYEYYRNKLLSFPKLEA